MSDTENARLHLRIDTLKQLLKELDEKNADKFREMRQAVFGDSIDLEKIGILRRIQSLEASRKRHIQSLETSRNRKIRIAQIMCGFLAAITAGFVSWLLGLFGAKP